MQAGEIRRPVLAPFGHQYQRVGVLGRLVRVVHQPQPVLALVKLGHFIHGLRVVRLHRGARLQQGVDQHQRGGLTDVIGVGFEGKPPHGNAPAFQVAAKVPVQHLKQLAFLAVVHDLHRTQDIGLVAVRTGRVV